jgi:glycosyltransferase involved in cell wall biosynthesis
MLRDGHVCEECLTGSVINAFRHRCQQGDTFKSLLLSLEAYWQKFAKNYAMLDCIIAPSEFMRQTLLRKLPDARIEVIVNGIDASSTVPGETAGDYFLYIGRLSREKGVPTLAQAQQKMQETMPLKIVGDGPWAKTCAPALVGQFLGYMKHGEALNNLIRGARAVIVPSEYYENCSMSVLEAMAFGRPVIGGNIGGIPEQIRDGVDGYLVEPGNSDALAQLMDKLAADPQQARRMGINARQRLEENTISPAICRCCRRFISNLSGRQNDYQSDGVGTRGIPMYRGRRNPLPELIPGNLSPGQHGHLRDCPLAVCELPPQRISGRQTQKPVGAEKP